MPQPTIVTCAVTGSAATPARHAAVPVTPAAIADSALEAGRAGAAIVHIHVRDPATGLPSSALPLYREVVERIRARMPELILNLTTGPGGRYAPDPADLRRGGPGTTLRPGIERVAHVLELRPEMCSLDVATMNRSGFVMLNTPEQLDIMARAISDAGIRAELEVFDGGQLELALHLAEAVALPHPRWIQFCLGVRWGMPATRDALAYFAARLPPGTPWSAFAIGADSLPMAIQAARLGGHVRVGFEDNLYLARGALAPSNAALVTQLVDALAVEGRAVASCAEARAVLGLAARAP